MNRFAIWFSACVIAIALAAVPAMFGEIDDHGYEQTTAAELSAMQAEEAMEARKQVAGDALCKAERGAGADVGVF
jgi:hypothetical protein